MRNSEMETADPLARIGGNVLGKLGSKSEMDNSKSGETGQEKPNWSDRNPLARWAHRAFQSALDRGLVTRKPCEVCGDPKTEFHHFPDKYDQPLTGQHLCRLHHRREHARLRSEGM
ncbi:hypothetical protein IMCC20628_01846 [Hoeflea sp. IMCC20628]|nr:hypothetical protein IMCC20628_01846 [Hoeflea sp. IMCC20628]